MAACRGIAVVRLADRLVLTHRNTAAEGAAIDDAVLWSDLIGRCAALNEKAIDRISYTNRDKAITLYAVARKSDGIGAVAIMSDSVGQRVGYLACEKSMDLFLKMFVERPSSLTSAACASFNEPLAKLLEQFSDSSIVDERVAKVKRAVEDVREMALENVERVIERGERIESMVEQTEQLQENARGFQAQSTALRRQMWWNNMRTKIAVAAIAFGFLFVVYITFCGGLSCKSDSK
jgi:vesicle-associated membrane protein 7